MSYRCKFQVIANPEGDINSLSARVESAVEVWLNGGYEIVAIVPDAAGYFHTTSMVIFVKKASNG